MKRGLIVGLIASLCMLCGAIALGFSTQTCALLMILLAAGLGLLGTALECNEPPTLWTILRRHNYIQGANQ